jgi:hypothetical protein
MLPHQVLPVAPETLVPSERRVPRLVPPGVEPFVGDPAFMGLTGGSPERGEQEACHK